MNSFILMAEIVQEPQLRYTPDNQIPVAEMLVQFPGVRAEDPPATLKVVGWRNVAQEIKERCHPGDRVVLEGRLGMITMERPEGFKEKRAELTVQRIHYLGEGGDLLTATESYGVSASPVASTATAAVTAEVPRTAPATKSPVSVATRPQVASPAPTPKPQYQPDEALPMNDTDVDDIPF